MKKDIFIDNNVACRFSNPMDKEVIKLIEWLLEFKTENFNKENNAHLVVSKKLFGEYYRSAGEAKSNTAIPVIINKLTQEGRLVNISNVEIKDFQNQYFTKTVKRKLRSNHEDREHIPVVLLSDRKFALTNDDNLIYDLVNFSGFNAVVSKKPENLPYRE